MSTTEIVSESLKNTFTDLLSPAPDVLASETILDKVAAYLQVTDLPDSRNEDWKYTDLRFLQKHKFSSGENLDVTDLHRIIYNIPTLNANQLVFINGHFLPAFSRIISKKSDLVLTSLADAKIQHPLLFNQYFESTGLYNKNFFAAFNTQNAANGLFLYVPENKMVEHPVHIINFTDGNNKKTQSISRNLIVIDSNSQAQIIQTYHSLSVNFTFENTASEIILMKNARLVYNMFQGEGNDASQITNTIVKQDTGSEFTSNCITICGALVRNNLWVHLNGGQAVSNLNGFYLPDREHHFENHVQIFHNVPDCISNQLYKGIIDNKAMAVFTGRIVVAKDAQKTNAFQSNKNVLLTPYARAKSRPQLEIYADDVKCSHGSSTGQIDADALFYMQSRGIGRSAAIGLLLNAYAKEVIEKIENEAFRNFVEFLIQKRMDTEADTADCTMIHHCQGC